VATPGTRQKTKKKAGSAAEKGKQAVPELELPASLTVKELADRLNVEPVRAVKQLMRHGVMANVNQTVGFETAALVAQDIGYKVRQSPEQRAKPSAKVEGGGDLRPRPPVVTVMGHVDHGKTTLLDTIRKTNVTAREAGAITQHIGAYQVAIDGRKITFLDTPGHKAFTAIRARGAQATDIVILVVAADDGVMPQTREAVDHAKAAGVAIVVAVNKMDKPEANLDRVKQQLAEVGLVVEEWGGDTVCVPISAKRGDGIPDLLENVFLVSDIMELKADPECAAEGVVVEAKLDKSRGSLATLLVQKGTLVQGNIVVAGTTLGRVKAMFDDAARRVKQAGPSSPVEVLGLNGVPDAGDLFRVVQSEQEARAAVEQTGREKPSVRASLSSISSQIGSGELKELNVVLKTDVQGSIEPVKNSIEQLSNENVRAKVIHAASGSVTEGDVLLASASRGIVIGFNAKLAPGAQQLADREGVSIQHYDVIYRLEEDMQKALSGMLEPIYEEVVVGRAEVRAIFLTGKRSRVAGAYVREGKLSRGARVRVLRQGQIIHESQVAGLRRFKDEVTEVANGLECGVAIEGFNDLEVGDLIEATRREKVS
jgi:translation initiation factor IF-2